MYADYSTLASIFRNLVLLTLLIYSLLIKILSLNTFSNINGLLIYT